MSTDTDAGSGGAPGYIRVEGTDIVVRCEIAEHYLRFRAVEIVARDVDGNPCDYGPDTDSAAPTPDAAELFLAGSIKWDGCTDLYFGDGDGYVHLCGGRSWAELSRLLEYVWREAHKIPGWMPDIADADAFAAPSAPTP